METDWNPTVTDSIDQYNGMDWVKEIFLERCKKKIVKNSYNISKMWLQYNIGNLKDAVDIDGHVNQFICAFT